jgi:hypothetical protein
VAALAVAAVAFATESRATSPTIAEHHPAPCGGEHRWDVKTLSDLAQPGALTLSGPLLTTIDQLVMKTHGTIHTHTARINGVETTIYQLKAVTLVESTVEDDKDIHLVIRDDHGAPTDKMIVEFPRLDCGVNAPTSYRKRIGKARTAIEKFIEECGTPVGRWTSLRGTATIKGVGFFDLPHSGTGKQHGVAGNDIELHPVLSFSGSCPA